VIRSRALLNEKLVLKSQVFFFQISAKKNMYRKEYIITASLMLLIAHEFNNEKKKSIKKKRNFYLLHI
jgi:hypothetical protein